LSPQRDHLLDRLLVGLVRDQLAVVAALKAERHDAAEIPATRLLVGFRLRNPLANAIALGLGKGGGDGELCARRAPSDFDVKRRALGRLRRRPVGAAKRQGLGDQLTHLAPRRSKRI
jgi:hypothetical protein